VWRVAGLSAGARRFLVVEQLSGLAARELPVEAEDSAADFRAGLAGQGSTAPPKKRPGVSELA